MMVADGATGWTSFHPRNGGDWTNIRGFGKETHRSSYRASEGIEVFNKELELVI
jgi:hypothetical protein